MSDSELSAAARSVKVSWGANANRSRVSSYTLDVLMECLATAGETHPMITSTARTPADQARVMYEALQSKGVTYWNGIYAAPGRRVIAVYAHGIQQFAGDAHKEEKVRKLMLAKILELGPGNVSHHCANYAQLNVVDIGYASLKNQRKAYHALLQDKRIAKVIEEGGVALHVEIPQPHGAGATNHAAPAPAHEHKQTAPAPVDQEPTEPESSASGGHFDLFSPEGREAFKAILPERSHPYAGFLLDSGKKHGLNPFALWAMMERESSSGTGDDLDQPGPGGRGDNRHGHGLMQIDDRSWGDWLAKHDWADPAVNIDFGARLLREFTDNFRATPKTPGVHDKDGNYLGKDVRPLSGDALNHAGLAGYNAGWVGVLRKLAQGKPADSATTGNDYSSWILKTMDAQIDAFDKKHGTTIEKTILLPKIGGGKGNKSAAHSECCAVDSLHTPDVPESLEACLDPDFLKLGPVDWLRQNDPIIGAEPPPPDDVDWEVEALCLVGHAKEAAYTLRRQFGKAIKFASGFRTIDDQAAAMATQQHQSHVVRQKNKKAGKKAKNPADENYLLSFAGKWVDGPDGKKVKQFESKLVQKMHDWCAAHENASKKEIYATFHGILKEASLEDVMRISKHVAGRAFDLEPIKGDMAEVGKKVINFIGLGSNEGEGRLAGKTHFTTREGLLESWHLLFEPKEGDLSHEHLVKKYHAHQAKKAITHIQQAAPKIIPVSGGPSPTLDSESQLLIATLAEDFREHVLAFLGAAQAAGIPAQLESCYRSWKKQWCYRWLRNHDMNGGRDAAKPGRSAHAYGYAVDLRVRGHWAVNSDHIWKKLEHVAQGIKDQHGKPYFAWGGYFPLVDIVHWEIATFRHLRDSGKVKVLTLPDPTPLPKMPHGVHIPETWEEAKKIP